MALDRTKSGNPVHGPQFVEHGASDPRHAVRLELDAPAEIECVDRIHQAEYPRRDQIVEIDPFREALPDPFGVVLDQRQISLDQVVAQIRGGVFLELPPEFGYIHIHLC